MVLFLFKITLIKANYKTENDLNKIQYCQLLSLF